MLLLIERTERGIKYYPSLYFSCWPAKTKATHTNESDYTKALKATLYTIKRDKVEKLIKAK